jgi:hypothetical protein
MIKHCGLVFLFALLVACDGGEGSPPVSSITPGGAPKSCFGSISHTEQLGGAEYVLVAAVGGEWVVVTGPGQKSPAQVLHYNNQGSPTGAAIEQLSDLNGQLGSLEGSVVEASYLITGHNVGDEDGRPTPLVLTRSLAGKNISSVRWSAGVVTSQTRGDGGFYAAFTTPDKTNEDNGNNFPKARTILKRVSLGGGADMVGTLIHNGALCGIAGGVTVDVDGNLGVVYVTGDRRSRSYNLLFEKSGRNDSFTAIESFATVNNADMSSFDGCRPELVVKPLGIFPAVYGGWQVFWVSALAPDVVTMATLDRLGVVRSTTQIIMPKNGKARKLVKLPNGNYLVAYTGDNVVGVVIVHGNGEAFGHRELAYAKVNNLPQKPENASTVDLAVLPSGDYAALVFVTSGGQGLSQVFSIDCE